MPETLTNGVILRNLSVNEIYKKIDQLITHSKQRQVLQKLSYKNFYLTHQFVSRQIDDVRKTLFLSKNHTFLRHKKLRILHITNFNERHNGRLF